jgi:hypothetical protein
MAVGLVVDTSVEVEALVVDTLEVAVSAAAGSMVADMS